MKLDDNNNYFLIYVNYPVTSNKQKHLDFFNENSFNDVWGVTLTARRSTQMNQNKGRKFNSP